MIDRYTNERMAAVWSDEGKVGYLVHAAVLSAELTDQEFGLGARLVSGARDVRSKFERDLSRGRVSLWTGRWTQLERKYHHDIAAFVEMFREELPAHASSEYFHLNRTSSDLVDTALAFAIRDALKLVETARGYLVRSLALRALEHQRTTIWARTHGQRAEVTSIGRRLAQYAVTIDQQLASYGYAKMSGPVGVNPGTDAVLGKSGFFDPVSTQVVPRFYLARLAGDIAAATVPLSDLAVTIRLGSREGGDSWCRESRGGPDARGSSAMPTKRNPVRSERVSGLCTRIRSDAAGLVEAVAGLWEERDISHSSVERLAVPEMFGLLHYTYLELADVVRDLQITEQPGAGEAVEATPAQALAAIVMAGSDYTKAYEQIRAEGPYMAMVDADVFDYGAGTVDYDPDSEPEMWAEIRRMAGV